ncbi:flagellar hook-length control protein FliK [Palleronia pelagia]|uniref:Hook-length control protein FliK n=1 Tax=Palleronia pelagia TaxID=387096 RepID=A0A1H8F4D1_9RHOB|nr:flagellar hook-length control protein FliK [Palleronia pelagia]SEN26532.1 hook-length control protein FliK [Palleronia pelagia]
MNILSPTAGNAASGPSGNTIAQAATGFDALVAGVAGSAEKGTTTGETGTPKTDSDALDTMLAEVLSALPTELFDQLREQVFAGIEGMGDGGVPDAETLGTQLAAAIAALDGSVQAEVTGALSLPEGTDLAQSLTRLIAPKLAALTPTAFSPPMGIAPVAPRGPERSDATGRPQVAASSPLALQAATGQTGTQSTVPVAVQVSTKEPTAGAHPVPNAAQSAPTAAQIAPDGAQPMPQGAQPMPVAAPKSDAMPTGFAQFVAQQSTGGAAAQPPIDGGPAPLPPSEFAPRPQQPLPTQATAPAPPTPTAPSPELPQHVARQIRSAEIGDGKMRIELRPHGIGELEIEIAKSEAGRLQIVVRAEQAPVLAMIRNDRDALMQALHARGLETDAADLDFQGFDRGNGQGTPHRDGPFTRDAAVLGSDPAAPEDTLSPVARIPSARGLNILT